MDKRFSEALRRFHVEPDNGLLLNTIVRMYKTLDVQMLGWDDMVLSVFTNDIIKKQESIDFRKLLVPNGESSFGGWDSRMHKAIPFNEKIYFSVQCSHAHYCTPRRTLRDIYEYTCMEIALSSSDGLIGIDNDIFKVGILKGFPNQELFQSEGTVAPYVGIEVVQGIFDFLRARIGLCMNDVFTMMSHTVQG